MIATSHRAMVSNGGNARAYAEALLNRICRNWGLPREELHAHRAVGRRVGDSLVRQAVIATFLRDIDDHLCSSGVHENSEQLSVATVAELLGMRVRNVYRYLEVIRLYQQQRERRSMSPVAQERVNDVGGIPTGGTDLAVAMTGFDRAALEELVLGGGA